MAVAVGVREGVAAGVAGRGAGEENAWDGAAGPRSAREAQAVKISRSMRQSNCRMNLWVIIARLDGGESRIVL